MGTPGFPLCVSPLALPTNKQTNNESSPPNKSKKVGKEAPSKKHRTKCPPSDLARSKWVLRRGGYEYIVNLLELSRKMNNSLPPALEFHINSFLILMLYPRGGQALRFWKVFIFSPQQDSGLVNIYF